MQYYFAPMEGVTTYIYRNAHARYFGGIDKYFTPFISDKQLRPNDHQHTGKDDACSAANKSLNAREIQDILPDHNQNIPLVPQILTNQAERFLTVAQKIASYGYDSVNLNLGCPSGTVTAKKRGAGFLSVPDELDAFLYKIYEKCPLKISVKTRLGVSDLAEWERLLEIYAKYPIDELIIHTRLQRELYAGKPHPEAYARAAVRLAAESSGKIPLCYNGDIVSKKSLEETMQTVSDNASDNTSFSESQDYRPDNHVMSGHVMNNRVMSDYVMSGHAMIDRVMIGRGLIQNPALAEKLRAKPDMTPGTTNILSKERLRAFHDEILDGYIQIMSGDSPTLFKMKDLWSYMSQSFTNSEKYLKKIHKANRLAEYVSAVDSLFGEQEIRS